MPTKICEKNYGIASGHHDLNRVEDTLANEGMNNRAHKGELDKVRDVLASRENELAAKRSKIRVMEDDLAATTAKQADLNGLLSQRDLEYNDKCIQLSDCDKELALLADNLNREKAENDHLNRQLGVQLGENDKLRTDAHDNICRLEAILKEKDGHLAAILRDTESAKLCFDKSQIHKADLNNQLVAINKHIGLLGDQNTRLGCELAEITDRNVKI
jgi:chromosome segregation ATPase